MKNIVFTADAPAAIGPYSQAVKAGDTLYLSGQIGMNPATGELVSADVKEQTAQALKNMKAVLAAAGATTFASDAPARSCVAVAALPKGARVEVEAIAVL